MRRLLLILFVAGAIAGAIAWIADRQGELVFTLDAYEIHMSAPATIGFGVLFTALVILLARLITTLVTSPGAIGAWFNARRIRRGNDSLSHGLLAVAAGDHHEAHRHADRARGILGTHPLALLLQSQAAVLANDGNAQRNAYRAMLNNGQTEFLGLRGLFLLAAREEQPDQAMVFAERAYHLRPRVPWAAHAMFDLEAARGQWDKAHEVLNQMAHHHMLGHDAVKRRRAVLLTAKAIDADDAGALHAALEHATEALALDPGLAPAAVLAARKLAVDGKAWRAQGVVEACWATSPHPDLADVYASVKPDETHEERVKRLVNLAHLNRDHFESRVLEAEEAVHDKDWSAARRILAPLADDHASARVCALMAEIEEGENADATSAHIWLARAARAARDAEWHCTRCASTQNDWTAVCNTCASFDTLQWAARGPAESHAHHPSAPSVTIEPVIAVPHRKKPQLAAAPNIVSLPRPPDDPGPSGADF